jgi:hypothetical protein
MKIEVCFTSDSLELVRAEPELDAIVTIPIYYKLRLNCFCMKEDHTLNRHRCVCDMQLFISIFVTFL